MNPSCFLNILKPPGETSRAAVDRVCQVVGTKRVGHAGTLDPLATGVLIVGVEKATRLVEYIQRMPKEYLAEFQLGRTSDTDDVDGEVVVNDAATPPSREALDEALRGFVGRIAQTPPAYSAVKLAGRRAYDLARKGKPVVLKPRPVEVYSVELLDYQYPAAQVRIRCGSGTYIRSIGRDLGVRLGVGGVMSKLERTSIGPFSVANGVPLAELTAENWRSHSIPLSAALEALPKVSAGPAERKAFLLGQPFSWRPGADRGPTDEVAVVAEGGEELLGVGKYDNRHRFIRPVKGGFV